MKYKNAVNWLFEQFPAYQNIGAKAYKPGLNNIKNLLEVFGNPQKDLKFVHVAGTNGKGSTCSMIASVLTQANNNVGLFTSPHIEDFRERIRINGEMINRKFVIQTVLDVKRCIYEKKITTQPSFFEISFLMALLYFKRKRCNICVIETGLGGRLDATNCITPILSIITNISLEHTTFLGNSLEEIASEKAGVIKKNIPVVIGEKKLKTKYVFQEIAKRNNAPIIFVDKNTKYPQTFSLTGAYQYKNAKTAIVAIRILQQYFPIKAKDIVNGMKDDVIYKNTGLFARSQLVGTNPFIWIDVAHNPEGVKMTLKNIKNTENLHIVYGTSADKDLDGIFKYFPKQAVCFFTEFSNNRSASIEDIKDISDKNKLNATFYKNIESAIEMAKKNIPKNGTILVLGSFFLISDFMRYYRKIKK